MANKYIEKIRYTPSWWCRSATAVLMASLLLSGLSSCFKEVEGEPQTDKLVEILSSAQFATGGIEITSQNNATQNNTTQTKAPIDGTSATTFYFSRADETTTGTYGSWSATAFSGTRAAGTGATAITFSSAQYYLPGGGATPLKTKITGWCPGDAASGGAGYYNGTSVEWVFDGSHDIMTCTAQEGSRSSAMTAFEFKHKLTQTIFHPYAHTQEIADFWGKITKIEVLEQMNTCTYAMSNSATENVTFSDLAQITVGGIAGDGVALSVSTDAQKENNAPKIGNPVMIQPQDSPISSHKLRITTEKKGVVDVSVTGALTESTSHKIFLNFTAEGVFATVPTITAWQDGYTLPGDDIEI